MTKRKSVKENITQAVFSEIPKHNNIWLEYTIDELLPRWWYTGRNEGLRLTDIGTLAFQAAQIEFYDIEFKQQGSSWYSFLVEVNNKINCPYYLGSGKKINNEKKNAYIRLYDSKVAMLINLYGSLEEYLTATRSKHDRRKEK
jgi:hypothetical protein